RLFECDVRGQFCVSVQAWAKFFAAVEIGFRQFDRRKLFGLDALGKLADGQIENFFGDHRRALMASLPRRRATEKRAWRVSFRARREVSSREQDCRRYEWYKRASCPRPVEREKTGGAARLSAGR